MHCLNRCLVRNYGRFKRIRVNIRDCLLWGLKFWVKRAILIISLGGSMGDFLTDKQKENLNFFYGQLDSLLVDTLYNHKYVLINNKKIDGVFDTFENALTDAVSKFQPYEYVIQQVISKTDVSGFLYPALAPA